IDNTPPAGAIVTPTENATVSGSITVNAAASDLTTGVASVQFRIKATGDSDFTTIGSDSTSPYSTVLNSVGWADGSAQLQIVITDGAGNTATSAVRDITIDNTAPTVTLDKPTSPARGTITLSATASASASHV